MRTLKHFLILCVIIITLLITSDKPQAQWQSVSSPLGDIWDVHFINNSTGIVSGYSGIIRTTNSGTSWSIVYPAGIITGVAQVNDSVLVVCDFNGSTYRSSNRGINWMPQSTILPSNFFGAIDAFNQTVVIGGTANRIAQSINGGFTYTMITLPGVSFTEVTGVDLTDENTVYITTTAHGSPNVPRVYKSTNKGNNWTNIYTPSEPSIIASTSFNDIKFKDSNTGFVCSSNGRIARTTNAGVNWDIETISNGKNFQEFEQVGNDSMFVCCSTPEIFHTADMSLSWTSEATFGGPTFLTIGYGANYLWAGGYGIL